MSVILSLVLAAAARVGAPVIKSLLHDKVGGVVGDLGETIIDAVAQQAGVPSTELEQLPAEDLDKAVAAVEGDAPALLGAYLAAQKETNRLMLAEMDKSGFGWMWRPAAMWGMLVCIAWYVFVVPLINLMLTSPLKLVVTFGDFTTIFVTFIGLYMGGHTAKAVFKR